MYYRLAWPEVLIQRLAACYLMAKADGLAVEFTSAVATIEKALIESPADQGESRSGNERIMIVQLRSRTGSMSRQERST
jgi:hypothetical protein